MAPGSTPSWPTDPTVTWTSTVFTRPPNSPTSTTLRSYSCPPLHVRSSACTTWLKIRPCFWTSLPPSSPPSWLTPCPTRYCSHRRLDECFARTSDFADARGELRLRARLRSDIQRRPQIGRAHV